MVISDTIRSGLLKYLIDDIDLGFDIEEVKNKDTSYELRYLILKFTGNLILRQTLSNGALFQSNLNKLVHFILGNMSFEEDDKKSIQERYLNKFKQNHVKPQYIIENILCLNKEEHDLVRLCKIYNNCFGLKQRSEKNNTNRDNRIVQDKDLFEMVMQKALNNKVENKTIMGRKGVGLALIADAVVDDSNTGIHYIIDTKFYSNILDNSYNKAVYKSQNNRFQMCSYIEAYSSEKNIPKSNIQGLIVHAVDAEHYEKWKILEEDGKLDIGKCKIQIKFIHIDTSADKIINQFKRLIKEDTQAVSSQHFTKTNKE